MSSFKSIKNKHDVYKDKNVFAHSMLTDIKFSKALVSKIFCSGRFLGSWLNKVGKKVVTNFTITLAGDKFPGFVSNIASNATSNAINEFERRISGEGAVRAGKGFTLFILNEDMKDIITIIKSLEDLTVLIVGVTETVKLELKEQECCFVTTFISTLLALCLALC